MDERLTNKIDVCDDFSPFFEEESMPESIVHAQLVRYLVAVLQWLFRDALCAICENFAFLPPLDQPGPPVAPDIAVIKGVALRPLSSWRVQTTGPAPHVVFEILSVETWKQDLEEKPDIYARLGVQEYFAYDPTPTPLASATQERLFGWRRDPLSGRMTPLWSNEDGFLWSEELVSYLVPHEQLLRLADGNRRLRLTEAEAQARARWEEARARRAEAAARQAAERRDEALAEKLRSLGVDPDRL
jgi:Uma2 family endonuclease